MNGLPGLLRPLASSRDTAPRALQRALHQHGCTLAVFGEASGVKASKVALWSSDQSVLLPSIGHCLRAIEAGGAARQVVITVLCWLLARAGCVVHLQHEFDFDERRVG